ncbi:hypothetical protein Syun_031100 [Stephania yunnanensis]|uniref:Uncharacterized protein n=1 Tax=Stephania yunnanensis TaxID=152371 RepID=A0AAP0DUL0_9MAGN
MNTLCLRALLDGLPMFIGRTLVIILGFIPLFLSIIVCATVEDFFPSLCQIIKGVSISSWKKEFEGINVGYGSEVPEREMAICVNDMCKWRSYASKRFSSGSYMAQILLRRHPSVQSTLLNKIQQIGRRYSNEYKVTCLSMVLLVKIVGVLVPSSRSESLRQAMDEAFEVIYFIDERINVGNFEDRRRRVAKLLWNGGDLKVKKDSAEHNTSFPALILKEVNESPVEEYEERAAAVLKLLYKLDPSLEDEVQWSFPLGANITRFFDPFENSDEGIPSDTTVGDVATAEGTATISCCM